jgi:hypothetical protein
MEHLQRHSARGICAHYVVHLSKLSKMPGLLLAASVERGTKAFLFVDTRLIRPV